MQRNQINIYLLYVVIFLVYTQGFWERFTTLPAQGILEAMVILLTFLSFNFLLNKTFILLFLSVTCGVITSLYTDTFINFLKYIRFLIYFYILFEIMWNTFFTVEQFNRFIRFIVAMVLLQGLASIYQSFIIGNRVEGYVGFMSSIGGSTATSFPVLVTGLLTAIYLFSNKFKKKWYLLILLLFFSVSLLGYSSGKRAIYFFIPVVILFVVLLCYRYYPPEKGIGFFLKRIKYVVFFLILLFPIFISGIKQSAGLSYGLMGSENSIEIIVHAAEYVKKYESATSGDNSIGRSGSTKNILSQAVSSPMLFLFGSGYGSIKDEIMTNDRNIGYGIVGFTRDVFSGGVVFAILIVIFYIFILNRNDYIVNNCFSSVMKWSLIGVFFIIHFTYSSDFIVTLKLNALVLLVLCVINSHHYSHIKIEYSKYL